MDSTYTTKSEYLQKYSRKNMSPGTTVYLRYDMLIYSISNREHFPVEPIKPTLEFVTANSSQDALYILCASIHALKLVGTISPQLESAKFEAFCA